MQLPVEIKNINKAEYTLTMVASTQDVDRHGDTIMQSGWDLKQYKKNPVILNSHNYYDATEVIAKATRTEVVGKGKRAKLEQDWKFAVEENPKAKIIFDLYAGGFLSASSVGFIVKKFKENQDGTRDWYTIEEAELLEVSAVSVPANAAATLAKALGLEQDELRAALKFTDPNEDDEDEPEDEETETPAEDEPEDEETETPAEDEPEDEETETPAEDEPEDEATEEDEDDEEAEEEEVYEQDLDPEALSIPAKPTAPKSMNARVVDAIRSIEESEKEYIRKAHKIITELLDEGEAHRVATKTDYTEHSEKVRKRKVNQAIRSLLKAK